MRQRNARIAALRAEGLSYEKIARIMKMPRATVQSAAAAALREQKKN
jgi:DNA-directed RNA polymerase specialized sigma24 family protein